MGPAWRWFWTFAPLAKPQFKQALKVEAKRVRPVVKPKVGTPETHIVVSFTASYRTGVIGQTRRGYLASVKGPGALGCIGDTGVA